MLKESFSLIYNKWMILFICVTLCFDLLQGSINFLYSVFGVFIILFPLCLFRFFNLYIAYKYEKIKFKRRWDEYIKEKKRKEIAGYERAKENYKEYLRLKELYPFNPQPVPIRPYNKNNEDIMQELTELQSIENKILMEDMIRQAENSLMGDTQK